MENVSSELDFPESDPVSSSDEEGTSARDDRYPGEQEESRPIGPRRVLQQSETNRQQESSETARRAD